MSYITVVPPSSQVFVSSNHFDDRIKISSFKEIRPMLCLLRGGNKSTGSTKDTVKPVSNHRSLYALIYAMILDVWYLPEL